MQETCQFKITHIHAFDGEKVHHQKPTKFCLKTSYFQEQLSWVKALIHKTGFGWYNTAFFL